MKVFILEDNQSRITLFEVWYATHELSITDDAMKAIEMLKSTKYDIIFLDHDLDNRTFVDRSEENTGYTVAKVIKDTINSETQVVIHSMNPVGVKNMISVLEKNRPTPIPFGVELSKILK